MTQKEKILHKLQERGSRGVHSFEFYEMYIPRFAARIKELRNEGHNIESINEKKGCRYVWHPKEALFDLRKFYAN